MKQIKKSKLTQILLIVLVLVMGLILALTKGFNKELKYKEHQEIKLEIGKEYKKTDIKEITNEEPIYLRPPYGNTNQNIKNISNMYTILWNLDTEDWKYKNVERISNYIVDNAKDGSIVLLHDLYETSVDGALLAMEKLEKEGYAFVTIDELAKLKNIELKKEKSYYQINN